MGKKPPLGRPDERHQLDGGKSNHRLWVQNEKIGKLMDMADDLTEASALDHLHRKVRTSIGQDAHIVNRNNVGMLELGTNLRLFHKTGTFLGLVLSSVLRTFMAT